MRNLLAFFIEKGPGGRGITFALAGSVLLGLKGFQFEPPHPFLFFFVTFFLISGLWILVGWLVGRSKPQAWETRLCENSKRIADLPIGVAREYAEKLLKDSGKYQCIIDPVDKFAHDEEMPPHVRDFFKSYRSIMIPNGDENVDRTKIVRSRHLAEGWVIGRGFDLVELTVTRSSNVIYELDGLEQPGEELAGYPSLYHWLLTTANVLYDLEFPEKAAAAGGETPDA
ncbi:MAG: hypothetical protein ABFD69_03845 [Candidatus Sumerlaeia bacterium]